MAIAFKKTKAVFIDIVGVEEAEILLEWLHNHPKGKVDLTPCTHLHTAVLQVLMAARPPVIALPSDMLLAGWLDSALKL